MNKAEKTLKSLVLPIMAPVEHLFLHTVLKRETPSAVEVNDRIHICSKHENCDFSTVSKQLLDEVEHDIINYRNRGLCYLPKPKASTDNTDTRF